MKKILIVIFMIMFMIPASTLLFINNVKASSPITETPISETSNHWNNPEYSRTDGDYSYASCSEPQQGYIETDSETAFLMSNYSGNWAIPGGSTITGIQASFDGYFDYLTFVNATAAMSWDDGTSWTTWQNLPFSNSMSWCSVNGLTGHSTWTISQLNHMKTRIVDNYVSGSTRWLRIDGIKVIVTYTEPPVVYPPIFTSSTITDAYEFIEYSYQPTCNQTIGIGDWTLDTDCPYLSQQSNGKVNGTMGNVTVDTDYYVNITAHNDNGLCYQNYTLTLWNNPLPDWNEQQILNINAYEDKLYSFTPLTTQLITSWHFETNATWLSESPITGKITGTPVNLNLMTSMQYYVNWTGANKNGTTSSPLNFTIYMVNKQPEFTWFPTYTCYNGSTYSYTAKFDDQYSGGVFCYPYVQSNAPMLSYLFFPNNGDLFFYPNSTGKFWFNITIDDQTGASNATNYLNWTVTVTNKTISPLTKPNFVYHIMMVLLLIIGMIVAGLVWFAGVQKEEFSIHNVIYIIMVMFVLLFLLALAITNMVI